MKKTFWLLDVSYEVKDHQPEMRLWGIDEEGKQVVPAASRILSLFDITKDELQPSETPSLSKFMKS